jgi:hypothetical protein
LTCKIRLLLRRKITLEVLTTPFTLSKAQQLLIKPQNYDMFKKNEMPKKQRYRTPGIMRKI